MSLPVDSLRLQVKLFFEDARATEPRSLVPLFHEWIKLGSLEEMLFDVVDYGHVPHGPAVVLIGHGSDYGLDFDGRAGLLYSRKRDISGDFDARFADAIRRVVRAATLIEKDSAYRFMASPFEFRILDRLRAPNSDETFASVAPLLSQALEKALGSIPSLRFLGPGKGPFAVETTLSTSMSLHALAARIQTAH